VEVLMGITLFAIGAGAVMAMQRATIQGNADARKFDVANAVAREWLERLRRDAALWTTPTSTNPNSNYANAKLLSTYLPYNSAGTNSDWKYPDALLSAGPPIPDGVSPAFDILGRDLAATDIPTNTVFCVNIRLNWLVQNMLARAEVRVFWPRLLLDAPPAGWCGASNTAAVTTQTQSYHFIYAATAIRQNPAQ
jgi:hypothetical protein